MTKNPNFAEAIKYIKKEFIIMKIKIKGLEEDIKVTENEIKSITQVWKSRRFKGVFTHIGSIGEYGRESYSKFSAIFGIYRYPGANCGISILGIGSTAKWENFYL